jgi:Spy/CpxP family protein refolding chaperone
MPQGMSGMGPGGPMMMRRDGPRRERDGVGMGHHGMGRRDDQLGRLLEDPTVRQQLGVTAEQAAKIRQQESDFRKAEIRNGADLRIKRMDLDDLLAADKADRAAIDKKLQEISASQLAVEKSAIDYHLAMRDALTPAQRQRLERMMAEPRPEPAGGPASGAAPAPRGPQGGGRGGRGATAPTNPQGQTQPNP